MPRDWETDHAAGRRPEVGGRAVGGRAGRGRRRDSHSRDRAPADVAPRGASAVGGDPRRHRNGQQRDLPRRGRRNPVVRRRHGPTEFLRISETDEAEFAWRIEYVFREKTAKLLIPEAAAGWNHQYRSQPAEAAGWDRLHSAAVSDHYVYRTSDFSALLEYERD